MAYKERIKYDLEVDLSSAQATMSNAMNMAGQSMSGAYGSLQQGAGYVVPSMQGSYNSFMGAHAQYRAMNQAAFNTTSGMHSGVVNAAAIFNDPSINGASAATGAAMYTGATAAGWGAVGKIAPGMSAGYSAGSAMAGRVGFGGLGKVIGGVAGSLTAMVLPYMAVDAVVEAVGNDMAQRNKLASSIGTYSGQHGNMFKGANFSQRERRDMASYIQDTAYGMDRESGGKFDIGVGGASEILHNFGNKIFKDPNISTKKFREAFSAKAKQVKDFAMAFDKSIKEAIDTMKSIEKLAPGANPMSMAANLGSSGALSGLGTQGMTGVANSTANAFQSAGMSRYTGAKFGMQAASDVGTMFASGMISKKDMAMIGGAGGAAKSMGAHQAAFANSSMGSVVLAAAYKGGKIDSNVINGIISGDISTAKMMSMASGVAAGGKQSMSDFNANRDKLASSIDPQQQQALMSALVVRSLNMSGMAVNQTNLAAGFKNQFGMSTSLARVMSTRLMNPEIYAKQMDGTINRIYDAANKSELAATDRGLIGGLSYRSGLTGLGRSISSGYDSFRRGFRHDISDPIGDGVNSIGKGWRNFKDSVSGRSRYSVTSDMLNMNAGWGDASGMSDKDSAIGGIRREAISENFGDVVSRAHYIYNKHGENSPEWVKKVRITGPHGGSDIGDLSDSTLLQVQRGVRKEIDMSRRVSAGYSRFDSLTSGRLKKLSRSSSWAAASAELGGMDSANTRSALAVARKHGIISGNSSSDQETAGALLGYSGTSLDKDFDDGLNLIDSSYTKGLIEKQESSYNKISSMVSDTGFWSNKHGKRTDAPLSTVFGTSFARAAKSTSSETKIDMGELFGLITSGKTDVDTANRVSYLANKVQSVAKSMPEGSRKGILQLVNAAYSGLKKKGNTVTGGTWDATTLGDSLGRKVVGMKDVSGKLLSNVKDARGWMAFSSRQAISADMVRKMSFGMTADSTGYANINKHIAGSTGSATQRSFTDLVQAIKELPTNVAGGMDELTEMMTKDKYLQTAKIMAASGGAYGKAGKFVLGLKDISKIQKGDLLEGAQNITEIKELIDPGNLKFKTDKEAQTRYITLKNKLLGMNQYKDQMASIDKVLGKFRTGAERLGTLRNIIRLKGKNEKVNIRANWLASLSGTKAGERVTGGAAGAFSAVAKKQIELMNQQLKLIRSTQKGMGSILSRLGIKGGK